MMAVAGNEDITPSNDGEADSDPNHDIVPAVSSTIYACYGGTCTFRLETDIQTNGDRLVVMYCSACGVISRHDATPLVRPRYQACSVSSVGLR